MAELEQRGDYVGMRNRLAADAPRLFSQGMTEFCYWDGVVVGWLGRIGNSPGAQQDAIAGFDKALKNGFDEASCLFRTAVCLWRVGELAEAESKLARAESLTSNNSLLALIYINSSIVRKEQGRYAEALKYCEAAEQHAEGEYLTGLYYLELANVLGCLEDYETALMHNGEAAALFDLLGHKRLLALTLNNRAHLFRLNKQPRSAQEPIREAHGLAAELSDVGLLKLVGETSLELITAMQEATRWATSNARSAVREQTNS